MTAIDPEARDALAQFRASLDPSRDVAKAQWEAIVDRVEAEEAPGDAPAAARHGRWALAAAAAIAAGLVVWLATRVSDPVEAGADQTPAAMQSADRATLSGNGTDAVPAPEEARADPPSHDDGGVDEAVVDDVVADEPQADPATIRAPDAADDAGPTSSAHDHNDTRARPKATADPLARLDAEVALVGQARRALGADDPERALRVLRKYARRHPGGAMAEEAALLEVQALCQLGDVSRWSKARDAFTRRYPDSPLRVHLRQDCGT